MELLDLYKPFLGSQSKFLDKYPTDSEEIAENFWRSLDDACTFFVPFLLLVSIGLCIIYFYPYNNLPGRHYKRTHWVAFYIITVLVAFLGTVILGYLRTNPSLNGSDNLIWKIAFGNLIYSIIIFGLFSCLIWLFGSTNTYNPLRKK